jgi:hypothetical protein
MGCHLGWHFPVGVLWGAAEENINNRDFCFSKNNLKKKVVADAEVPPRRVYKKMAIPRLDRRQLKHSRQ